MIIKSFRLFVVLLLVALNPACRKQSLEPTPFPKVFAGVHGDSFHFVELDTPRTISVDWDSNFLFGFGIDSLDMDHDGKIDLVFHLSTANYDSAHLWDQTYPFKYPYLSVHPKNGYQITYYMEIVYQGLGQGFTQYFANPLAFENRIDSLINWRTIPTSLWARNPGSEWGSVGDWHWRGGVVYLGVRKNAMQYGWLAIDNTEVQNPKFMSYALSLAN